MSALTLMGCSGEDSQTSGRAGNEQVHKYEERKQTQTGRLVKEEKGD